MPMKPPFKGHYSVGEWWAEHSQSIYYKEYENSKAWKAEAAELRAAIEAKIAGTGHTGPSHIESKMGCATFMAFSSLQSTTSS